MPRKAWPGYTLKRPTGPRPESLEPHAGARQFLSVFRVFVPSAPFMARRIIFEPSEISGGARPVAAVRTCPEAWPALRPGEPTTKPRTASDVNGLTRGSRYGLRSTATKQ